MTLVSLVSVLWGSVKSYSFFWVQTFLMMKNCSIVRWRKPSSQFFGVSKNTWTSDMSLGMSQRIFNMLGNCWGLCLEMYPPSFRTIFLSAAEECGWSNRLGMSDRNWFNTLNISLQSSPVQSRHQCWWKVLRCVLAHQLLRAGSCACPGKYQTLHLLIAESPVPKFRLALSREYGPKCVKKADSAILPSSKICVGAENWAWISGNQLILLGLPAFTHMEDLGQENL